MTAEHIIDRLLRHAARRPDKVFAHIAVLGNPTNLTYGDLVEEGSRFARLYASRGLRAGDVVFISLKTSRELVTAFVGAMLAGCVPSMMPFPSAKQDSSLFWSSHNELFRHLGGGLIVTYEQNVAAILENIDPGLMQTVTSGDAQQHRGGGNVQPVPWAGSAMVCLQHSSGTTGLKKGIPLTADEIDRQIDSYRRTIGISADDVIASWLPLYHDMGFVACFLMPLWLGATVVMLDPFEWIMAPVTLLEAIAAYQAKFVWMPNFAFNHLVNSIPDDRRRVDLSHMTAFINCSEPCKIETFDRFHSRFAGWGVRREHLQVCYAMAEAVFAVTQSPIGQPPRTTQLSGAGNEGQPSATERTALLLSTGTPIEGVEVRIYRADGSIARDNETGEIALAGRFVFKGYHKQNAADAKPFRDGFYLTGDIGMMQDGQLYVMGRQKDLIIICGKNFFAHDVEAIVSTVPGVKPGRSVAFGVFNDALGSEDMIVVAERLASSGLEDKTTRLAIRQALENAIGLVPKKIVLVEEGWLIKSTSGKVSRKDNLAKYLGGVK